MGCCFGCFQKKDDLNKVNQDDILWLQTSSSLTTGIPSNLHFSIGGQSNMSGQEPAVLTSARKAQEKAEREKAKLEAQKNKAATNEIGKSKAEKQVGENGNAEQLAQMKASGENENAELQKLSVETLTEDNVNTDEPMTSKAESQEPVKGKASQEPKATDNQLSNGKNDAKAVVEMANEALLASENTAEVQREVETAKLLLADVPVKAEASKVEKDDLPSKNTPTVQVDNEVNTGIAGGVLEASNDGKVSSALPQECVGKTEDEVNDIAKETEAQADAIIEADAINQTDGIKESDVTNEIKADVVNKVQTDVSNKVHLDVIIKPAIATKPSQISITFEMGAEVNPAEAEDEAEGGAAITEVVNLPDQSVAMETVDRNDVIKDNEGNLNKLEISAKQDGSTASESVPESQVASGVHIEKGEEVTTESQNGQDITSESQVSNELQSESEVANEVQGDSNDQQSEVANDDDEAELSWMDMSFSQPLVPQLSEVVRIGVIARVPEDDTPVEASDNDVVASAEDSEGVNIVANSDK